MFKNIIFAVLVTQLAACAGVTGAACRKDYRDREWDAGPCQVMFEQIPNWRSKLSIQDAQQGPAARTIVIVDR